MVDTDEYLPPVVTLIVEDLREGRELERHRAEGFSDNAPTWEMHADYCASRLGYAFDEALAAVASDLLGTYQQFCWHKFLQGLSLSIESLRAEYVALAETLVMYDLQEDDDADA